MNDYDDIQNGQAAPDNEKYRVLSTEFIDFDDEPVKVATRFKRPNQAACTRTVKEMNRNPGRALNNLLMACVHNDDRTALQEAMEKYPGIATTFGGELLERSGFSAEVVNRLGK